MTTAALAWLVHLAWPGLAIAAGLGLVVGYATMSSVPSSALDRIVTGLFAVFVIAVMAAAWSEAVPGRAGLWLETALLLLAPYVAGCVLGYSVGRVVRRDRVPRPPPA